MYRGFNLKLDVGNISDVHYKEGERLYSQNKIVSELSLRSFLDEDGSLDVLKMKQDWFPQINADVFISHSHCNLDMAIKLAGWLFTTFGIKSFIDSCVWGHANNLLKDIDDIFCYKVETNTYNYSKRNNSTSHVHMILSTALNMMIDKTECIIFLNTPDSICAETAIDRPSTYSPWIYSEIAMTQLIRTKIPERYKGFVKKAAQGLDEELLRFKYPLDLLHLTDIDENILDSWETRWEIIKSLKNTSNVNSLDILYKLCPVT